MNGNNRNKIKTVILDYGEVLCHRPSPEEFQRMASLFGVSREAFAELWLRNRGAFDRGDLTADAYWAALGEDAGRPVHAQHIAELRKWDMEMWGRENAIMVNWMRALRANGIQVGLLSNMHAEMVAYVRKKFAWLDEFDFQTFSADVKMVKPCTEIYEYTLRGMGVVAEESLFVDDRIGNVETARTLGMTAIQFESVAQLRTELKALSFTVLPTEI